MRHETAWGNAITHRSCACIVEREDSGASKIMPGLGFTVSRLSLPCSTWSRWHPRVATYGQGSILTSLHNLHKAMPVIKRLGAADNPPSAWLNRSASVS